MDNTNDHLDKLMCAVQAGDREAFVALIEASQVALRSFLALRLRQLEHLDDIEQNTWVTCFQRKDSYQGGSRFIPWLLGIAHNLARSHMRQVYRHRQPDMDVLDLLTEDSAGNQADFGEPANHVIRHETSQQVRTCVDALAPTGRRLVKARYFEGISVADIASKEGRDPNWVSVTLMRCRKALGKCLSEHGVNGSTL